MKIAKLMIERGYVSTIDEAFNKYLGREGIAYVMGNRLCSNVERGKKRNVPTVPLLIDKDVMSVSDEGGRQIKMLYDRINRLELFDRAIILLWLESMSYDEIAAIVGIATSAVTSRLFRIKEQLKSMSNH